MNDIKKDKKQPISSLLKSWKFKVSRMIYGSYL